MLFLWSVVAFTTVSSVMFCACNVVSFYCISSALCSMYNVVVLSLLLTLLFDLMVCDFPLKHQWGEILGAPTCKAVTFIC